MNTKKTPIKRHPSLKPFSRDHHYGLLLGWKIREGFRRNVELKRMKKYTDWFFVNYLKPHFEAEEKYMFPVLPEDNKLIKRAISEHRKLEKLFKDKDDIKRALSLIEEKLDEHIRFEERTLFQEIQEIATEDQLQKIEEIHETLPEDNWKDEFWKDEIKKSE